MTTLDPNRSYELEPTPVCPNDCDHEDLHELVDLYYDTLKQLLATNSVLVQDDVGPARLLLAAVQALGVPPLAETMLQLLRSSGAQIVFRDLQDEGVSVRFMVQRKGDEDWPSAPQGQPPVQEMIDSHSVVPRGAHLPALYSRARRSIRTTTEPSWPG